MDLSGSRWEVVPLLQEAGVRSRGWNRQGITDTGKGSSWRHGDWWQEEQVSLKISTIITRQRWVGSARGYMQVVIRRCQVCVVSIQVIVIVYAECWDLTRLMVRWQYPLLHGRLLTTAADDVDGCVLWVLVYEGEAGGILLGERDLVYHP